MCVCAWKFFLHIGTILCTIEFSQWNYQAYNFKRSIGIVCRSKSLSKGKLFAVSTNLLSHPLLMHWKQTRCAFERMTTVSKYLCIKSSKISSIQSIPSFEFHSFRFVFRNRKFILNMKRRQFELGPNQIQDKKFLAFCDSHTFYIKNLIQA